MSVRTTTFTHALGGGDALERENSRRGREKEGRRLPVVRAPELATGRAGEELLLAEGHEEQRVRVVERPTAQPIKSRVENCFSYA